MVSSAIDQIVVSSVDRQKMTMEKTEYELGTTIMQYLAASSGKSLNAI